MKLPVSVCVRVGFQEVVEVLEVAPGMAVLPVDRIGAVAVVCLLGGNILKGSRELFARGPTSFNRLQRLSCHRQSFRSHDRLQFMRMPSSIRDGFQPAPFLVKNMKPGTKRDRDSCSLS